MFDFHVLDMIELGVDKFTSMYDIEVIILLFTVKDCQLDYDLFSICINCQSTSIQFICAGFLLLFI